MNFLAALLIASALSGGGEIRVKGSTAEEVKASLAEIADSLPESEHPRFERAIRAVGLSKIDMRELMSRPDADVAAEVQASMVSSLKGKTGQEIMNLADRMASERGGWPTPLPGE